MGKENNKVVAYRCELTIPRFKHVENNKLVPTGETDKTIAYFVSEWYPVEELDYGNFWEYSDENVYPAASDGFVYSSKDEVRESFCCECKDCSGLIMGAPYELENPGDFVEKDYPMCNGMSGSITVRITALGERPRLCAEKFEVNVRREVAYRVKVYGKRLAEDRCVVNNRLWRVDYHDWMLSLIREKIRDNRVKLSKPEFLGGDGDAVSFIVTAPDESAIKDALRDLGAGEIGDISIERRNGNEIDGTSEVVAEIVIGNHM